MLIPPLRRLALVCALAVVGTLPGCGGGGGGSDGGTEAPAAGPLFTADFVPLATGDRRSWRLSSGALPGSTTHERVGASAPRGGFDAFEVRDETGTVLYMARNNSGLFVVSGPGSDALIQAAGAVETLRFGLGAGQSAVTYDRSLSFDLDGDLRADSLQLRVSFTVVGFETVTTPAGSFPQAAHVRSELRTVFTLAGGGGGSAVVTADEWYVRGIGRVRASTSTQSGNVPPETELEEITAWGVGGQRSENEAPRLLAATPAEGSILSTPDPLLTLDFSEELDPLALDGDAGLRLLGPDGGPLATTRSWLGNRTSIGLRPQAPLPDGRYTLRLGSALADLANNPLGARDVSFTIDTARPRLASSQPALNSQEAPLSGTLSLTFNEDIVAASGTALFIEVRDIGSQSYTQRFVASISGNTLSAPLTTPLPRNRPLQMQAVGDLSDRAGNALSNVAAAVSFRTDPGPLARPQALAADSVVFATRLGDLDGDGRQDIVFTGAARADSIPYLGLRPGLAGGGFGAPRRLATLGTAQTCEAREMTLGDFDGDGRLDVALACYSFLRVYLQTAPGSFVFERPGWNGGTAYGAGDFNGDGRADLVLVGTPPGMDVGSRQAWHVITRSAGGGWTALATLPLGADFAFPFGASFADIDNDGRPDLVWVRRYLDGRNELAWAPRLGHGLGPTQAREIFTASGFMADLAVGDVDRDGVADVFITGERNDRGALAVLRGLGAGQFSSVQWLDSARAPIGVRIADIDGDGRPDVVVSHRDPQVSVYLQVAGGALDPERLFESTATDSLGFSGGSLHVVDVDGDGLQDLLAQGNVLLRRPFTQAWPAGGSGLAREQSLAAPVTPRSGLLRRRGGALMGR